MKYRIVTGRKGGPAEWAYYVVPVKGKITIYETLGGLPQTSALLVSLRAAAESLFWIPVAEPATGFPHPEEANFAPATDYLSGVFSGNDAVWAKERLMILRAAAPYVPGLSLDNVFVCLDGDHTVKFGSQQIHLKWRVEKDGQSLAGLDFKSRLRANWKPKDLYRLSTEIKQVVQDAFENGQLEPNF